MAQFKGEGFKYYLDNEQLKDYDEFERKIKNKEITIKIEGLNVRAKSV